MFNEKAWHVGNTSFREAILKEGLKPNSGLSYNAHFDNSEPELKHMGKVVFFTLDENKMFDSTYDDDIWEITIPSGLSIHEDPSMKFPMAYTKSAIPAKYLKLIYKGTGEDTF